MSTMRAHPDGNSALALVVRDSNTSHFRNSTPYRDRTTYIVLEPLDFIGRLAALLPPPRIRLTR